MHLGATFFLLATRLAVQAVPLSKRSSWTKVGVTTTNDVTFELGDIQYLANVRYPKASVKVSGDLKASAPDVLVPFTVITVNGTETTGECLEALIGAYTAGDDVFTTDFLEGVYLRAAEGTAKLSASAVGYLTKLSPSYLLLDADVDCTAAAFPDSISVAVTSSSDCTPTDTLPSGPYAAKVSESGVTFGSVHRLYADSYRDFLFGTYDSNDGEGSWAALELSHSQGWYPSIPVPSRIYSWADPRPLAGARVGVKDLYDMKGLVTSGGSIAWATVTPPTNATAPCIQRIVDLGGVLVGKNKLAQFASGADPWDWQDEMYPWNPRGDGYLTCSASSSGGGCSVAAYDWLDYAIGSDTGSSMRRPAAVSGIYGNRPSQGMITLEKVIPLGDATDTAGVFSRDPKSWVHFAKHWYTPELVQGPEITGLSPLVVPDSYDFAKRILYLTDYLPLNNSAAEEVLQGFLTSMADLFDMKLEQVSFQSLLNASTPNLKAASATTGVISRTSQWRVIGKPLVQAWAKLFDGRFPPVDEARRPGWQDLAKNDSLLTDEAYSAALKTKKAAVDWFEENVLYSTKESCSESIMIWDIGTGGRPSYREKDLIEGNPEAAYLAVSPERAAVGGASICPIYGCVDITIPIGQVPYYSNITNVEEYVPVTASVVAKRGCDFMLMNMVEKMADAGLLKTVKTGRTPF